MEDQEYPLVDKLLKEEYEKSDGFIKIPMDVFKNMKTELYILKAQSGLYDLTVAKDKQRSSYPLEIREAISARSENRVKLFRQYRKISQRALAEKVGVSKTMICHIESGRRQGSSRTLQSIANALMVDLNDLI